MRKGVNPTRGTQLGGFRRQRVIVPVYIPTNEGYFAHSMEILKLCLESLYLTSSDRVSITVVSNGSMSAVVEFLQTQLERGHIHQLMVNDRNWGKIDAALSAIRGRFEQLLTITDADVLFLPGWVDAVEDVFRTFPECGFATPAPNPTMAFAHTTSTILAATVSRELRFKRVVSDHDMDQLAHSIGRSNMYRTEQRCMQMVVRRNGATACVGGGHFVFTLRRDVAWRLPRRPALTALRPFGETAWFDDPPDRMGFWRLSTPRAYARHMGNTPEPWMYEELERCRSSSMPAAPPSLAELPAGRPSRLAVLPFEWRRLAARGARKLYLERRWSKVASRVERSDA